MVRVKLGDKTERGKQPGGDGGGDLYPDAGVWRIKDMPERLRPREELDRVGVRNVSDDVLLAILLRSGVRGSNVKEVAVRLLSEYGSLTAMSLATVAELGRTRGLGPVKSQVLACALEIARRLSQEAGPSRMHVRTPSDVVTVLRGDASVMDAEVFWALNLDARNRLKGKPVEVSRGLLDSSLVHPREFFRAAIAQSAAAVVAAHNHPSGDPSPSAEDVKVTRQLVDAGKVIGIRLLDHVVLGRSGSEHASGYVSMRESGCVDFG